MHVKTKITACWSNLPQHVTQIWQVNEKNTWRELSKHRQRETRPLCTGRPWQTVLKGKSSSKINALSRSGCNAICSVLTICLSHTHTRNLFSMFDLFTVLTNTCLSYTPCWHANIPLQFIRDLTELPRMQSKRLCAGIVSSVISPPLTSSDVVMCSQACALPAFSVWDWLLLLLAGDEGGPPHRTAVAGSEPAHRRRGGKRSRAEPVIWLSVRGQRRRRTPHCHERERLVNTAVSLAFINMHKQTSSVNHTSPPVSDVWDGDRRSSGFTRACRAPRSLKTLARSLLFHEGPWGLRVRFNLPWSHLRERTEPRWNTSLNLHRQLAGLKAEYQCCKSQQESFRLH